MLRGLTLKQAEKWLERLKQTDPAAFKDLGKCLRKYDQTSDEYECFVKMNQALYPHPVFAQQINGFMEEGNKFVVNRSLQDNLKAFLDIARNTKYELFREIVIYVKQIANEDREIFDLPNKQAVQIFKSGLLNIVGNNPILVAEVEKIIPQSQEEAFKNLDLRHLQNKVITYERQEVDNNKQLQVKKVKKPTLLVPEIQIEKVKESSRIKVNNIAPTFLTTTQQKSFIKQHEKRIGTPMYQELIKILDLYFHNIITRFEFCELVGSIVGIDLAGFKDITQSREIDRRKSSTFKPLSDIDFHISRRQTHSYVEMPSNYPHFAANRGKKQEQVLNNKWVSVPRGSEVTFNVRIKNGYEIALNKCEDQRYEFDLIMMRLRKFSQIVRSVIKDLQIDETINVVRRLNTAISLGVLPLLYRNISKEQKQIFEDALANNTLPTLKITLARVQKFTEELQQNKKLYAIRCWNEVAQRNFYKSLDFKNHEFKNCEKIKMRPQTFIEQLSSNVKYLQSRGSIKINENPFEGKKQFFSILNSFQSSSRKQRCMNRKLPTPLNYSLTDHKYPSLLPAMILAFEDQQILFYSCSLMYFYIETVITNEGEKVRCKITLKQIMSKIFKIKTLRIFSLNSNFDEDKFFSKLQRDSQVQNPQNWVDTRVQSLQKAENAHQDVKIPFFNSMQDTHSEYNFQPPKSEKNIVFYASQHFYTFLRFLYSLYERLIRMREVASDMKKVKMFEILYFACIRAKQSNRFEDGLNSLFKEYAYLFTTLYKIIEGGTKSLNSIALSPLQNYSMSLLSMKNEQVYLLLLNRYMLNIQTSTSRLIRITYQLDSNLLYIHSFNPFYRFNDETLKQYNKKRLEISRNVEAFNQQAFKQSESTDGLQVQCKNYQQYYFQSYTNKLINLPSFEDVVLGQRTSKINLQGELQKLKKLRAQWR